MVFGWVLRYGGTAAAKRRGLVTYITDVLGHFLDVNGIPGLWQCCVRALGQVLLHMVLVLVLRKSTESLLECLAGHQPWMGGAHTAAGGLPRTPGG